MRATNVYEEKSLGVYEESMDDDELNDDAHWDRHSVSRVAIWGKYLARHARRQLSFGESRTPARSHRRRRFANRAPFADMWWLAISLFLLCIVEVRLRQKCICIPATR